MARFLISPGVITREIDQSQYVTTTGTGNITAVVGYAEKGPFEPTIVTSIQDFVQTYGKTLPDAPYLAQGAYKYFEEGDQLLVVRAGNKRDPDAYPDAAQYASKTVRVAPFTLDPTSATEGYQAFSSASAVSSGTFNPGDDYGFRVQSDFRGFTTPKYTEDWVGLAVETANTAGQPVPYTSMNMTTFKIAFPQGTKVGQFECNYKREHAAGGTAEYYGSAGSRSSTTLGSSVAATLRKYVSNGTYANVDSDFITITGTHGAVVMGEANLSSGYDFSTANSSFAVTVAGVTATITLIADCNSAAEVVTEINDQLIAQGMGTKLEAFEMKQTSGISYIFMKHLEGGNNFGLAAGTNDALSILGWDTGTYLDAEGIYGTWYAEYPSAPLVTFEGVFAFKLNASNSAATSFEDILEIDIMAPSSGSWTINDIVTKINVELSNAYDGTHSDAVDWKGAPLSYTYKKARCAAALDTSGKIRITSDDEASETMGSFVSITSPSTGSSLITLLGGTEPTVAGDPGAPAAGEALITIKAKEKGTYGNKLILRTGTEIVNYGLTSATYYNVSVLLDGSEVSVYRKVNWTDPTSTNYILTKMASDAYLSLESSDEDNDDILMMLPDGDWLLGTIDLPDGVTSDLAEITDFNVGTNGWIDDDGVITSLSSDFANALNEISNPEVYEFNLVFAPGGADPIVQGAIQSLCDSRRDCFGVVDAAPLGIGLGIKENTNDITEVNTACSTITSSYVGAFWPWLQDYDSDNQQYLWLPPSIYAIQQIMYTDNIADPWYAPAGTTRGRVSALDVEYSPTRLDRDLLYGDTNIVNPIVKFVNEGITIWGQKTGQRTNTATNRINVRRLMIYAEKLVAKMARSFLFEPNDTTNYAAFTRQANAILEPIRQRRGLQTYQVVCDETTNTPDIVDQNIMLGKIFVQPTKTIEFIEVEFTILASGEVEINEG